MHRLTRTDLSRNGNNHRTVSNLYAPDAIFPSGEKTFEHSHFFLVEHYSSICFPSPLFYRISLGRTSPRMSKSFIEKRLFSVDSAKGGLKVGIIGGGIGGLTAAASLLKAGFDVHVYEQTNNWTSVGGGIQVSPNASRIAHHLGLKDLHVHGVRPLAWHQRRWDDGRTLLRAPLGDTVLQRYGYPLYQVQRADLIQELLGHVPHDRLHLGHKFISAQNTGDKVEVEILVDKERTQNLTFDLLIGADGTHSAVRHEVCKDRNEPIATGFLAYRGVIPSERLLGMNPRLEVNEELFLGPGRLFEHYYVHNKQQIAYTAIVQHQASFSKPESWTKEGKLDKLRAHFQDWHPQVRTLLEKTDATFVYPLMTRMPLLKWVEGRIVLLGDACHPILPFMAQGAAQAMEDAVTLTALLQEVDAYQAGLPAALEQYEAIRHPRASRIQAMSAALQQRLMIAYAMSAALQQRLMLPDGPQQEARDKDLRLRKDWSTDVHWIYSHDAARPPKKRVFVESRANQG
eukprot:g53497.t1